MKLLMILAMARKLDKTLHITVSWRGFEIRTSPHHPIPYLCPWPIQRLPQPDYWYLRPEALLSKLWREYERGEWEKTGRSEWKGVWRRDTFYAGWLGVPRLIARRVMIGRIESCS